MTAANCTWAPAWSPDSVLAGLTIAPGGSAVGDLVSNAGRYATLGTITAMAPAGSLLDPSRVFASVLADVDGVTTDTPHDPADGDPAPAEPPLTALGDVPVAPAGGASHRRALVVPSFRTAGFRLYFLNRSTAPVIITVTYKQAT